MGAFVEALTAELRLRADALDRRFGPPGSQARPALGSLYLGGGTPSLLPATAIGAVIELVGSRFGLAADAEITIESNPGPDDRGDIGGFRRAGVNRISFGAQSLDPAELRTLGRRHRAADVASAVATARDAGIRSVSLDLLYDIPGSSVEGWIGTLDAALAISPDHLSLYALSLDDPDAEGLTGASGDHLPTTAGARRWRAAARPRQDDDRAAAQYQHAVERLAEAGWRGYEISNWARPGHESRHNLNYWERRPYEAAGPGAHAFDGSVRRWNAASLDGWLAALVPDDGLPPAPPPGGEERLNAAQAASERVVLGLRTDRGVDAAAAERPPLSAVFGWAVSNELVEVVADRVVLTTRGRLLSNELFSRLV